MMTTNLPYAATLLTLSIALVGCTAYLIGEWRGSKHDYAPKPANKIEVETALAEEIAATTLVIELPPVTSVDEIPPREMLEP